MKKILISMFTLAAVLAVTTLSSIAYFTDTEVSQDNVFTTGKVNLKVGSECHYYQDSTDVGCGAYGNWTKTNLSAEKFFMFDDIKPGDWGEDTVNLRVSDNDAWGRLVIENVSNVEDTCNEPELESGDDCDTNPVGDLGDNLLFSIFVDDGQTAGFQGTSDPGEGDNVMNYGEYEVVSAGTIDPSGETHLISDALAYVSAMDTLDNPAVGITSDGRMVSEINYYFGIMWSLPATVGNEVQLDSFSADMRFDVTQHRNNPSMIF